MNLSKSCEISFTHGENRIDQAQCLGELDRRLEELSELAPSDANANFMIRSSHQTYRGILSVSSASGQFVAGASSRDFETMLNRLFSQMHAELAAWRRDRPATIRTASETTEL